MHLSKGLLVHSTEHPVTLLTPSQRAHGSEPATGCDSILVEVGGEQKRSSFFVVKNSYSSCVKLREFKTRLVQNGVTAANVNFHISCSDKAAVGCECLRVILRKITLDKKSDGQRTSPGQTDRW